MMTNLAKTLTRLRQERREAERKVEKLDEVIGLLEGLLGRGGHGRMASRAKRSLSPAARRRIAQAQKARWKKWRARLGKKAA
jgi:hypothetical protein